jgi:hypothetical protein
MEMNNRAGITDNKTSTEIRKDDCNRGTVTGYREGNVAD